MIIYFLEANKIYTFKLPLKVSGSYILTDYDSEGNVRSLLNATGIDGKWIINENVEVKIAVNSIFQEKVELKLYQFLELEICGVEKIVMYTAPAYDNSFTSVGVSEGDTIIIGSGGCDINYSIIAKHQATLTYKNGEFRIKNKDPKIPIYVNSSRKEQALIHNFDLLFIMGLKIVVLGANLYINNPNYNVNLMSSKFIDIGKKFSAPDYKATSEVYKDFYEEKDYFYKTPNFLKTYNQETVVIASPPNKNRDGKNPLLMTIIPSVIMSGSSIIMGFFAFLNIDKEGFTQSNIMSLVMCATMLISGILWPFIERIYENFIEMREEMHRKKVYNKYLKEKDVLLENIKKEQQSVLKERFLSLTECRDAIKNRSPYLFSRTVDNPFFLEIRLGVGTVPLDTDIKHDVAEYQMYNDKLIDQADKLAAKYKTIENSPYTISLYEKNIIAFIGPEHLKESYLNAFILQLITYHSFHDLKIVILSDNSSFSSLKYLKNSKYCESDEETFRFYAEDFNEGRTVSEFLDRIFTSRTKEKKEEVSGPFYMILTDNISLYKNLKIIEDLSNTKENYNFGLVMFDDKVTNILDGCDNFVSFNEKEGTYFTKEMSTNNINKFIPEFSDNEKDSINIEACIASISNMPVKYTNAVEGTLPDNIGFLEMMGVGNVEQLNIITRWQNNNIVNSLTTPVGIDSSGNILNLDLHEKKHGPHGLIAGMTGSGKSEFIITFILSLAVNYSPEEVQFVLIDYKGGGLAGAFENRTTGTRLPHLVGTITNLDKAEMNRTLVSIESELQRRQMIFNEAKEKLDTGTIDIYKYQKLVREGKLSEPLSHLFIICDEFAELKAQQPDFMDELVSTARIGRSLGVHLILATQKPSGVVNDQIWANSKFKICCKVQTVEDSNEMIRRPDAAYLKEVGRFFMQVGYDEYNVIGQSAYTGMPYIPSTKSKPKVSDTIDFLNNFGEVIKTATEEDKESKKSVANLGEELTNILKYIISKAKDINFENQQLWLDNIPFEIYINDLRKKYPPQIVPFVIDPIIGEYDDPRHQYQGPVLYNINESGNTFIVGNSGSGKTTMLSTIIYSSIISHRTEEINFYIIDLLSESMRLFSLIPQVGEVLTINDGEKIEKLFYYLQKMVEKRKKYYAATGGSFDRDIKNKKSIFPNIVVMINGMDVFKEQFGAIFDNLFVPFTRDCVRNGITFIVTGTGTMSLGYVAQNNFPTKIVTRLNDSSDYSIYFNHPSVIPSNSPGRGLISINEEVYEFQAALISDINNLDNTINYVASALSKIMPKANPIPSLPDIVTISSFKNEMISLSSIPIGMEIVSACPFFYDFSSFINLILFKEEECIKSFIPALIDLFTFLNNTKNIVLSAYDYMEISNPNAKFYNKNFKEVFKALKTNFEKLKKDKSNNSNYIVTIFGYSKLNFHLNKLKETDKEVLNVDELINNVKMINTVHFVLIDECNLLKDISDVSWYNLANTSNGILVAEDFDNQRLLEAASDYVTDSISKDEAIAIQNGIKNYIKYVNK